MILYRSQISNSGLAFAETGRKGVAVRGEVGGNEIDKVSEVGDGEKSSMFDVDPLMVDDRVNM